MEELRGRSRLPRPVFAKRAMWQPRPSRRSAASAALLLAALPMLSALQRCTSALDCQLNGECSSAGACACNAGWRGEDCGELDLLPAKLGPAAYGVGVGSSVSSWGAGVLRDPSSGAYVMQVDEMENGCGLGVWSANSRCVLARSTTGPLGPYERVQTLVDAWCHGSTPARDPVSGRWVFQHMGSAAGARANCTVCGGKGVTPPDAPQGPCSKDGKVQPYVEGAFVSVGADPAGPYLSAPGIKSGANCENMFMRNGTLIVACPWGGHVSNVTDCGSPNQNAFLTVSVADSLAAALAGTYRSLPLSYAPAGSDAPSAPMCVNWEDQNIWVDADGHFHTLMHAFRGVNTSFPLPGCVDNGNGSGFLPARCTSAGGHAFSLDGSRWWISPTRAYTADVAYEDGSVVSYRARERPHLILSDGGDALYFVSAVGDPGPGGNTGVPGQDHSFTLVQQLGPGAR